MGYETMQNLHPVDIGQVLHFVVYASLAGIVAIGALVRWQQG